MTVSFSKPTDGTETGAFTPATSRFNFFTQDNALSRLASSFAGSLRKAFQSVSPIPEVRTRLWARQAFTA